jgi:hypothetical protein
VRSVLAITVLIAVAVPRIARGEELKVAVLFREVLKTAEKKTRVVGQSVAAPYLEQALADRGFGLRTLPADLAFSDLLAKRQELARHARAVGADLLVLGDLVLFDRTPASEIRAPSKVEISGQVMVIETSEARVMAQTELKAEALGSDVEAALRHALTRGGLLEKMMKDVIGRVRSTAVKPSTGPRRFTVIVTNVPSYRGEGRELLELLNGVDGAAAIEVLDYYQETLSIELSYGREPRDLADEILRETAKIRTLARLRLDRTKGLELRFVLPRAP